MEFSLPEFPSAPGAQAAFVAACFLIVVGLVFLVFPVTVGRFLGLESRANRPGGIGELRAAGGFVAGLALATLIFDQPVLYTALAFALLLSTFGRVVSLLSDGSATLLNLLLLTVQIVLTAAASCYFFDVITPDMQFSVPEAIDARLVFFVYAAFAVISALVMFGPRMAMAVCGLGTNGMKASAISTIRSAGGFGLGAGLAGLLMGGQADSAPMFALMVDLGFAVALSLALVGRLIALAIDRGNFIYAIAAIAAEACGAAIVIRHVMSTV